MSHDSMKSPSPHKIKETIKNNNKNLNDEVAVTAIENNTTIADSTMAQEEQQNSNNKNSNSMHSRHHNCNDCNETNTTTKPQTYNRNASTTNAAYEKTNTTTATFKSSNVENADENNVRVEEIMLINIQNNVDLNTFDLPREVAAATTTTALQNYNNCLPLGICMRNAASKGMLKPPQQIVKISCGKNKENDCSTETYDHDNNYNGGGGNFCRNNNNNYNNNNSSKKNNNNIILNTNSFVTVERTLLTCENESEQKTRNSIQNGYKNSRNAAASAVAAADSNGSTTANASAIVNKSCTSNNEILAEYSTVLGVQKFFSSHCNSERIKDPIENSSDGNLSSISSPFDSVLESFAEFLNAAKLETTDLNRKVTECHDLIDFSEDLKTLSDCPKENIIHDKCSKLAIVNLVQNQQEKTNTDDKMAVNNCEIPCNLENLLYCDLNETLEDQNLLERKEILQLITAEVEPTQAAKIGKTFTEVNEFNRISNNSGRICNTKILMMDGLNETLTKTPVTCFNVYSNFNNKNNNDDNHDDKTCAVVEQNESCQNPNICNVTTVTARTTKTTESEITVPLENITTNEIRSSSSIENISPPAETEYEQNHHLNQNAEANNCADGAAARQTLSISCSTTAHTTQPQSQIQTVSAEYTNICHHPQHEQEEEPHQRKIRIRDQFTSAYTLRDFAKCLKPPADEDIEYTLNLIQKENEKEILQKFNINLNSNKQINTNESVSSSSKTKSVENCALSGLEVNLKECCIENINKNNLYNRSFEIDNNGISYNLDNQHVTNFNETNDQSELKSLKNHGKNQQNVKLEDTQFLEIKNLSTPKFCNTTKQQSALNVQNKDNRICKHTSQLPTNQLYTNSNENSENIGDFDNELKFYCNEKIYTREKNSHPLLYLTFLWPTKNEGQVVTTRQQGNDDQGENESKKEEKVVQEEEAESSQEYRFNSSNNNNDNNKKKFDDKCDCSCKFSQRVLGKTYGTCNKKHVEGSHKGHRLKGDASKRPERHKKEIQNNTDDSDAYLLIDKEKCEYKNQCLQKTESKKSKEFNKNQKYFQGNLKNLTSVFSSANVNTNQVVEKEKEEIVFVENNNFNLKEIIVTNEKSLLQSDIINNGQNKLTNENQIESKSQVTDIISNNTVLNKTESVYNLNNGKNIFNLNQGLKRLNETNQQLLIHATYTPFINQCYHYHQNYNQLLERESEEHINLEEFEGSQRLKRLLKQHQQFRTRYDTIPTTQFDNYKQTNTITTIATEESLKTEIARNSKDDLCFANNNQERVLNTAVAIISTKPTTTTATKANKLKADCEITLERSSLIRANEYKKGITEVNNKNPTTQQKDYSNSKEDGKESAKEVKTEIKYCEEKQEICNRIKENEEKVLNNKETKENVNENKRNLSQALVSKKNVRLTQQQEIQTQQQSQILSNPINLLDLTDKEQLQHRQQQNIIAENFSNLRSPINKTNISQKPSRLSNLNLELIVKTKQLLQQQQKGLIQPQTTSCSAEQKQQEILTQTQTTSCSPPHSEPQLNDYKSAFVPTKPEIYKYIKPLTRTTEHLTTPKTRTAATIRLIPATASLSEFDTQRFSDFLYLNRLTTALNNNSKNDNGKSNYYNVNSKNNNTIYQIAHVLPIPYYPVYTSNLVDSVEQPYCYDELFLNETQQLKQHETLNAANNNPKTITTELSNLTTDIVNNTGIEIEDDLISNSSNNSSACDCINCQQQTEQDIDCVRDRLISIDKNVINELHYQQQQQTSLKMREVNGQLRGLLKKPNRPPPTRKNRVVFDETRNEFFEADYIILIREDCAYDEEDEEPCTCGEHELVRLCCEEGCQCNYSTATATTDDNRTVQSPKFAPPIEFVDEAALSPPDGYKDNGLKNTLGGALSGHIFGAQHLQQLQVIQRLQQQRAAMLAARNNSQIPPTLPPVTANPSLAGSVSQQPSTASSTCSSSSSTGTAVVTAVVGNSGLNQTAAAQQHSSDDDTQPVCTECAECAECAAKQLQQDAECNSLQCQEELTAPLGVPAVALLPIHTSSPERRMTQKEIIAGEERPRYVLQAQYKLSPVSESRIVREATEDLAANVAGTTPTTVTVTTSATPSTTVLSAGGDTDLFPPALPAKPGATSINNDLPASDKPPPIPPKENSPATQISGILKGGKLWKQDSLSQQSDDQNNTTSEDEAGSTSNGTIKRSVRFVTEEISNTEVDGQSSNVDEDNQINELIPIKKHSTLFKNALRPNSAVQQLFPSTVSHQTLTSEALRAFDESKRAGCLVSTLPSSAGDSDTLRRSMERNILRRSLIKKKAIKSDISLEDRIKQLTCGIDEDNDELPPENGDDDNSKNEDSNDLSHRDSPAGEENPQKFNVNGNNSDKSFSPNSSVSSSSSGSSAYRKITEIFNREKKNQEKIMEMEDNPIIIIPQECRCPAAPDLGMGVQVPVVHTQIHRTPPRQAEPKRQFLSTLAPLTACVAGNKDDLSSYYTLAAAHHNQAAQSVHAAEYNIAALMAGEQITTGISQSTGDEVRKVAPDVIAGTPGQEQQDELAAFAQQEANRTDKIKKRYSNELINTKEINSDDDEGNDYGFNKRPSVRGIKPKFSSTNEILQQMQDQLSQQIPSVAHSQPLPQPMKSYTLPKQSSSSAISKQLFQQQPSPQNVPHPNVATSHQQLPQQQQICNAVAAPTAMQLPTNAAIAQQQTEQRTWSFYSETGGAGDQQRLPVESAAAAMQQTYYQTLPAGAMFRHTMIHQHQQHVPEEAMLYAQNCQAMATTIEPQSHYGHYARSPTRRPESPPPLRNYHQTMVLIPYNAETYSQFAATNMDPKMAHMQRQNILEYQQVTQQTIRVPIGYALPGMQLHVVAGRGHGAQYATAGQTHHHQHQRIMTQRYQFAQDASMAAGFSERGVPEGAAAVSHSDCPSSGMVSPTTDQQMALQQQQLQQQQSVQIAQQQQQAVNSQQPQPQQTQNNMQSAAQGSVYYAMNV